MGFFLLGLGGHIALAFASNYGRLAVVATLAPKSVEGAALIPSSDLAATVWTSISALSAGPPSPFQLCPWPRFVSAFLPPAAA